MYTVAGFEYTTHDFQHGSEQVMANLNKVMLIGRLTREPEERAFSNGGKVASFGFAVNNPKKNATTGAWEDVPVWIDVKAFNRENGRKLADLVMNYLHKGHQAFIEGHLVLEEWEKDGQKHRKLVVQVDQLEFLQPKSDGGGDGGSRPAARPNAYAGRPAAASSAPANSYSEPDMEPSIDPGPTGEEIPF
jgi:single-strand DNA-binding protein